MKLKTYISNSVWMSGVPKEHRATNGNTQFTILIRARSQKRVAEITSVSLGQLRDFCGIHEAPDALGYKGSDGIVSEIVLKDETVYYKVEHAASGIRGWFEWKGKQ